MCDDGNPDDINPDDNINPAEYVVDYECPECGDEQSLVLKSVLTDNFLVVCPMCDLLDGEEIELDFTRLWKV